MASHEQRILDFFIAGDNHSGAVMQHFFRNAPDVALACVANHDQGFDAQHQSREEAYFNGVRAHLRDGVGYARALTGMSGAYQPHALLQEMAAWAPRLLGVILEHWEVPPSSREPVNGLAWWGRSAIRARFLSHIYDNQLKQVIEGQPRGTAIQAIQAVTGASRAGAVVLYTTIRETLNHGVPLDFLELARSVANLDITTLDARAAAFQEKHPEAFAHPGPAPVSSTAADLQTQLMAMLAEEDRVDAVTI